MQLLIDLYDAGLPLLLFRHGEKHPTYKNWKDKRYERDQFLKLVRDVPILRNVGLPLGPVSKLIDLEADTEQAEADYDKLFAGCDVQPPSFRSKRGIHRLFKWDDRLMAIGRAVTHFGELEIRIGCGKSCQSVLPPSDGREWIVPLTPDNAPPLPQAVIEHLLSKAPAIELPSSGDYSDPIERERALAALSDLSPTRADNYHDWLAVGMALRSVDDGLLSEWDKWSQQSDKYRGGECARKWATFNGDGYTIGSLIYWAKQDRPAETWYCTLRELRESHPKRRSEIVSGLIWAGDVVNIVAPPKLGKSYLVAQLALSIAAGKPWLDRFATTAGKVLVIDNELHGDTIARRFRNMAEALGVDDVDDKIHVAKLRGNIKTLNILCDRIEQIPASSYALIIVDALYRALPPRTDENANADVTNLYNMLDSAASKQGCAIAVVHHTSKGVQKNKSVTDVGSGAGAQSRAADCHLVLRPHENAGAVVMEAVIRDGPPMQPLVLVRDFPLWRVDETLSPTLRGDKPAITLDDFIKHVPDKATDYRDVISEASQRLGISQRLAKDMLRAAIDSAKVVKVTAERRNQAYSVHRK